MSSTDPPLFVPGLFLRVLLATMVVVLGGLVAVYMIWGPIDAVDITGTLVCTPIVAYLVHLWLAPTDPIDRE